MRTEDMRVQALKNPLGINENPVFSWQLVSDKKDEKNERQTAYRILVSESEASLINETGMLWDSGVVKESRCFGILYRAPIYGKNRISPMVGIPKPPVRWKTSNAIRLTAP